ncbi:excalibur calcium-binding domain-containing protein [Branchiibius sp. NY16-3462-2]|uniref:excalibur calcium-binding domain-containing protein n=1 Tax=Branchiibius sp. NY16-3462-2 TaxID=1807500 RepID=UPI00079CCD69|nr:excalibur calcium-binding domain-containing protein [Branchiibius sp. NY16-3462-2]KYH45009.1 calcium-binding protein [Branchiibius sp. NY16-3462-2]
MFTSRRIVAATVTAGLLTGFAALPADAKTKPKPPPVYKNCTALNKAYAHGVAKAGAKDKVSGKAKPVKNFTVNTAVYNANKKLDRDKDGIACEKR